MPPNEIYTELFRLIRSLAGKESDKSGIIGELCRIIRHLGSGNRARLRLFEIALVFVRLDHLGHFIANTNHRLGQRC
jgi:hypothetical protein